MDDDKNHDISGAKIHVTESDVDTMIREKIAQFKNEGMDDEFYVVDVNDIVEKYDRWMRELPRVELFYAVKCNHDPVVMSVLTRLGLGFDCANKGELKRAMAQKVPLNMVAYTNPCKQISHLRFARDNDISIVMFDNETELYKTKKHYPNAKLVLRIKPTEEDHVEDRESVGNKFGSSIEHARHLFTVAKNLDLDVVGVSFHVGVTSEYDGESFCACVREAKDTFDIAEEVGYKLTLLDLGGGFSGHDDAIYTFESVCAYLRPCLDELFPEGSGVRIIAEPGRYFVDTAFTLVVNVIAKRIPEDDLESSGESAPNNRNSDVDRRTSVDRSVPVADDDDDALRVYYINAGVFHSFMCRCKMPTPVIRAVDVYNPEAFEGRPRHRAVVWGPTMAPADKVLGGERYLPDLDVGDWLVFRDMGAYSVCMFSGFSSTEFPQMCYMINQENWERLKKDDHNEISLIPTNQKH